MASLESLLTRSYAAQTTSGIVTDDKGIALEIVHTSSDAVTSVTVVSATSLRLIDAAGDSGALLFATYDNLGKLVDKVNSLTNWKARILDSFRSLSTTDSSLIPNSAVTAETVNGEEVYKIFNDQSINDNVMYRVALDRGVLRDDDGVLKTEKPLGSHRVKIAGIKYQVNISGATVNGVRIYECDGTTLAETQIWGTTSVDNTATAIDFSLNPITAAEGNELVVRINDSAVSDAITNYLQVDYIRE